MFTYNSRQSSRMAASLQRSVVALVPVPVPFTVYYATLTAENKSSAEFVPRSYSIGIAVV